MVIVLDQDFQVEWVWDPFAWLDTDRLSALGEGPADWMHANAIAWSPADGNLLVSMRSLDWVIKIQYADGAGDGHVIWRLGQDGDFAIHSSDPSPWFSHQHDARYIDDTTLLLFDNGNTRQSKDPAANSRGQELVLDEETMQATLVVNADIGNFAFAVGSAERLPNGNFGFTSGIAQQTIEVLPDGTKTYVLAMNKPGLQYRSYIYGSLYGNPGKLPAPQPGFNGNPAAPPAPQPGLVQGGIVPGRGARDPRTIIGRLARFAGTAPAGSIVRLYASTPDLSRTIPIGRALANRRGALPEYDLARARRLSPVRHLAAAARPARRPDPAPLEARDRPSPRPGPLPAPDALPPELDRQLIAVPRRGRACIAEARPRRPGASRMAA